MIKQAIFTFRSRSRVDIAGNWREIVKKIFPESESGQVGIGCALSPMRVAGARQSCRNIRAGQNPRPITNTPSHPGCQSSIRGIFFSGSIEQFYASSDSERMGASGLGFNVFAVTGGFQRLTGKSSDERLTRSSRYSSAIKLPSTIPPAIKLVRGDTKPSERLRFGPRIIQ